MGISAVTLARVVVSHQGEAESTAYAPHGARTFREGIMQAHVLELVVFRLKEGVAREEFLATADAVSEWARSQPGFVSRDLSHAAAEDRWIEVVYWARPADAEAAAKAAETSSACAPMFALIDMDSALMLHGVPAITPVTA